MQKLQLVYAPNTIFRKKALPVEVVNDRIRALIDQMFGVLHIENGIGLGANMVGLLERIVVINMWEKDKLLTYSMVNPKIIESSKETQLFEEASLSFPGISAKIARPKQIKVRYLDYNGNEKILEADNFLSTVVQHEIDYLDGKIFLDYLSKMKRDILLNKMKKYMKNNPPHIHTPFCSH
jgi:peptide deformylase